ncbi:CRISPR-associated protein Cas2 [Bacillus sp. OG2]|nr:CRISPR-associated protein Cas2 [Bacillus sp. OG2]
MKRFVIMTVGKTHSGKSTFAGELKKELKGSFVMDQDNHAAFIHTYYEALQPVSGPNTLKHGLSKYIVEYAKENTSLHMIICNSNLSRKDRDYLLNELFPSEDFFRIMVHFQIPDSILEARAAESNRSTNIFRNAATFKEVLERQQAARREDPAEDEADYLFVIKNNEEAGSVIREIVKLSEQFY